MVGDDDEARDRVGDRVREVALSLQLGLPSLAVGDVDSAGDDADDFPALVEERRRSPCDHVLASLGVGEGVLVLGRREVRAGGVEAFDHGLPLGARDEDVPEVRPFDLTAVVEAGRDLEGPVEVPEPTFGVDHREQARSRVDDGLEESVLSSDLSLEALLLQAERSGRGDCLDELSLLAERSIVEKGRDALAALLDERRRVRVSRDRLGEGTAVLVDPGLSVVGPVCEGQ